MEKFAQRSFQDQHHGKDDSKKNKKRSAVASSKLGVARCTNKDKLVGLGDRLYKTQQQSNLTQKPHPLPDMKRKFQKTAGVGPGPKVPSVYNLRSKTQITKGAPSYSLRSKVQKIDDQNASINIQNKKTPKEDGSKDFTVAEQKRGILKNFAKPTKKMETTQHLTASLADLDMKNHPLTSQRHELFSREPIYHIKWEGENVENGPLGQNCIICNKDLLGATEDDDSEYNDDFQYDVDIGDDDEYYDDLNPPLLPAVDILSCGHAYHSECLQNRIPKEHSSDPQCILCYKMS